MLLHREERRGVSVFDFLRRDGEEHKIAESQVTEKYAVKSDSVSW
jgi:hypothetical protein